MKKILSAILPILPAILAALAIPAPAYAFDLPSLPSPAITATPGETEQFAAAELARLLARLGVKSTLATTTLPHPALSLGNATPPPPSAVRHDGYLQSSSPLGISISAISPKGVLNGVYGIARDLGFSFVMPGPQGELAPAAPRPIPNGSSLHNPRFKFRGVFSSSQCIAHPTPEWYRFLAKLRFNAYCWHASDPSPALPSLLKTLGFRYEAGGHVMHGCLPREKFVSSPELFRMFQPEDFNGKRLPDSNFCITHPETRRIVKQVYLSKIAPAASNGVYAVHAWADDLPAGGWCMCSRCRGLEPTDQSALAMNAQAEALASAGLSHMRVPVLAYHDTMFPSSQVPPHPLCFLLFAPRERCFAHPIDHPSCPRNQIYVNALAQYRRHFSANPDSHTFEYYSDKYLFRGHTPFTPSVIAGDASAYARHAIESWMSLQVGGEPLAPDWNMLAHAEAAWSPSSSPQSLTDSLSRSVSPSNPAPWRQYLETRAAAYSEAWKICQYPFALYFDYRFLPERGGPVGAATVQNLQTAAATLALALANLKSAAPSFPPPQSSIAAAEILRAEFETKDLAAMIPYARAMQIIGDSWNGSANPRDAIPHLQSALAALADARAAFLRHASPSYPSPEALKKAKHYYLGFSQGFMDKEIKAKIKILSLP